MSGTDLVNDADDNIIMGSGSFRDRFSITMLYSAGNLTSSLLQLVLFILALGFTCLFLFTLVVNSNN